MTTYTLSKTSPQNTTLIDPNGTVAYDISSTYHLGGSNTTIKKGDQILAVIHWKAFQQSTITWNGQTTTIKEIFPRSKALSTSRIYTAPSGEQFKWKCSPKLYCVMAETGINLATYDRTHFYLVRSKKSTLDITSNGAHLTDALVVTWAIVEKKARDRRRSRRHGGGGGGGGGDGG
ncbi:hypothetical protein RSOLAG22IIIB_10820 [Rhizoctonia solani]|uniref:DUF6593 domain-containing protein n=1 Tax=Rhizoctonia solani TaxID=456999 RepID=A0A0K6G511_9AGAM|nr:hypothetical protein RSOLAG22IIIB_10820 [Rhizoctonia solani]